MSSLTVDPHAAYNKPKLFLLSVIALTGFVLMRRSWRVAAQDPVNAARMERLRQALGRRRV